MVFFGDEGNVRTIDAGEINAIVKEVSEQPHEVIFDNRPTRSYKLSTETIKP